MKIRRTVLALLALCLLGGLIAALFTPTIAATLSLPVISAVNRTYAQPTEPAVPTVATATVQPTMASNGVTVLAQDTFQRPDQTFWGTSSGLRTWDGDAKNNPAFAIVHNAGQITGGQGVLQATLDVTSPNVELLVSGTVSRFGTSGQTNLGAVLRWQDTNNWYKALIDGNNLQLLSDVNGKISVLATRAFPATGGTNYSLRFRALGSNLFVKSWPTSQSEPANWTFMTIDMQLITGVSGIRVKIVPGVIIRITAFKETSVPDTM